MLEILEIDVFYGDLQALRGVSLVVEKGELVALVGSNGAGKTTTLRTISGIRRVRSGSIRFEGQPIDRLPAYVISRQGVAHVPEGRRLFPAMTVFENLLLGACTPDTRRRFPETIDFVFNLFPRLKDRRAQLVGTLSGGEQQMVAIGRSLASRPRLLMLDEPSLGLAPYVVEIIFDAIRNVNQEGLTVLLVEQNIKRALDLADRAYVLENGSVALAGKASDIAKDEHVRKAYLGI